HLRALHSFPTRRSSDLAETIESSGRDLLSLINDILDLARVEAGKVGVTPEPVDPRDTVARMARSFTPLATERGLSFTSSIPDERSEEHTSELQSRENLV